MYADDECDQKGFGLAQYAETLHKVMITLGYEEYGKEAYSLVLSAEPLTSLQSSREETGAA